MTTRQDPQERDVIETGSEPEFNINDVSRWEDAGDGRMRVFVVSKHGRTDQTEYSFVCSPMRLAFMCRKGLMFAAEASAVIEFARALSEH